MFCNRFQHSNRTHKVFIKQNQLSLMEEKFEFDYDQIEDVLYIYSKADRIEGSLELNQDITIDLDATGSLIGIEIFDFSKKLKLLELE